MDDADSLCIRSPQMSRIIAALAADYGWSERSPLTPEEAAQAILTSFVLMKLRNHEANSAAEEARTAAYDAVTREVEIT